MPRPQCLLLLAAVAASEAWSFSSPAHFLLGSSFARPLASSTPPRGGLGGSVRPVPSPTRGRSPLALRMEFLGFKLSSLGGIGDMIQKAEASHILVKGPQSLEGCKDLKELVAAKIDFPAGIGLEQAFKSVAEEYSACPSASKGGYLGSFKPGQMVEEFNDVVFTRSVGEMHGPVATKFGHHLILVHSRQGDPEQKKSGGCG